MIKISFLSTLIYIKYYQNEGLSTFQSVIDVLIEFWESVVTGIIILLVIAIYLLKKYKTSLTVKIVIPFLTLALVMALIGIVVGRLDIVYDKNFFETIPIILFAILIISLIILFLVKTVTYPLARLDIASKELSKKNFDIKIPSYKSNDEIGVLSNNLLQLYNSMKEIEMQKKELESEKSLINLILEVFPNGIIVLNSEGNLLFANKLFKNLYLKIFDKILPFEMNIRYHEKNELFTSLEEVILNNIPGSITVGPIKDQYYQLNSVPIDDKFIIEIRNISSFIKYEQLQKQFISTISHEYRTPLTAIISSVNNLIKYQNLLTESQKNTSLKIIQRNTRNLSKMIEDTLMITSIEDKSLNLFYYPSNIFSLIQNVLFELKDFQESKHINILVKGDQQIEVNCDNKKIKEVIQILIDNSLKYSADNTTITVKLRNNVTFLKDQASIEGIAIEIIDQGYGIHDTDKPFIFDRFYRSKKVLINVSGLGIGLYLAQKIVNLHKGLIDFNSVINKGTTFTIFLPINSHK